MKQSKTNGWFISLFLCSLYSTTISAAVFTVNQTLDAVDVLPGDGQCATAEGDCTLRAAVQETNALAGQDTIHLATGDYTLSVGFKDEDAAAEGDLDILDDLVILGAGIHHTTIIGTKFNFSDRTTYRDRIFHILKRADQSTPTVLIKKMTLNQGLQNEKGSIIYNHSNLTLDEVIVTGVDTDDPFLLHSADQTKESTLYNDQAANLTILNSQITHNRTRGLYNNQGKVLIESSNFLYNDMFIPGNVTADTYGAGAYNLGQMTIIDSTFSHNKCNEHGGGVWSNGLLIVQGSSFHNNHGGNDRGFGGGGGLSVSGQVHISDTEISNNRTGFQGQGGGIESSGGIEGPGNITLERVTISENYGGVIGGGVLLGGINSLIKDSIISGNSASWGGGIYDATLTRSIIENTRITGNSADQSGGGIFGHVFIKNSLIADNTAKSGGGVYGLFGSGTIENSTISGNQASTVAGGIYVDWNTTTITNVTLTHNSAPSQGANLYITDDAHTMLVGNTLITNPIDSTNCTGNITSLGYNLDSDNSCNLTAHSDQSGIDPKLDTLTNNGGSTQTHALLTDSPAINAIPIASCPDVDQRYYYRAADTHCDIGAFETSSSPAQSGQLAFITAGTTINESDTTVAIQVSREGGSQGAVSVHYLDLGEGTAIDNDDYATLAGQTLTWADGDDSPKQFEIHIHDDNDTEATESIIVRLAHASGGASIDANRQSTELTLLDDEQARVSLGDQVYVPLAAPCRIVDTRGFAAPFNKTTQAQQSFWAWGSKDQLDQQRDNDNSSACLPQPRLIPTSVMANVTAAAKGFKSRGNLVAFPSGQTPPTSSLVNFNTNNIANASIIALAADNDAHFDIAARLFGNEAGNQQKTHVIIDALGYFYARNDFTDAIERPDLTYLPLASPCRIVHTGGSSLPFEQSATTTQSFMAWGSKTDLDTQRDSDGDDNLPECMPEPGLTPAAIMGNVTVAAKASKSKGNAVAYPSDATIPSSSLINFDNNNIANAAIIALNPQSAEPFSVHMQFFGNAPGNQHQAHLLVDALGYFYPRTELLGMNYVPLSTPCRIVHTGEAGATFNATDHATQSFLAWGSDTALDVQRDSNSSDHLPACLPVPGLTPSAMMANVTVAAKAFKARGNVVAYPSDSGIPSSSLLNFDRNNIANASVIALNPTHDTHFSIHTNLFGNEADNLKQVNVVVDVLGYFYPE